MTAPETTLDEDGDEIRIARHARDCTSCSYCGKHLGSRHEHDHFPVPRMNHLQRGIRIRTACRDCHDLKDRIPLAQWPMEIVSEVTAQLIQFTHLPEARLLGDLMRHGEDIDFRNNGRRAHFGPVYCNALAQRAANWVDGLPYPARLLGAKLVAVSFHRQALASATGKLHAHNCTAI